MPGMLTELDDVWKVTDMHEKELPSLEARLRREVAEVHAFIAGWFRGDIPDDRETFDAGLGNRLADGLINIQPSGRTLTKDDLVVPMFRANGANPNFEISIRDFRLIRVLPDGSTAAAIYVEDQRGARNTTPADNSRITTVLFDITGATPVWLHLHETAVR